jgi:KAP family P-loop domain
MALVTPFRSFAVAAFHRTESWERLDRILTGNGGCYGLYGTRGAGKTWLMLMAIKRANTDGGVGLWFPCPSEYDADAFLSALSDNLANLVEGRYLRDSLPGLVSRSLRLGLSLVVAVPVVAAVAGYVIRGAAGTKPVDDTIFATLPSWLWLVVGIAIVLLAVLGGGQIVWDRLPAGRLVREAHSIRERIRFTTSMKLGTDVDIGGKPLAGRLRHTRERGLDERPLTVATLVFEFRRLCELIVRTTGGPLIIGIDELDKIEQPEAVLKLLRGIKGIFEIENVSFLVSVSEEAAAALRIGPLRTSGRNEFSSSFYTVIELSPLDPGQTAELLRSRDIPVSERRAHILCLLAAGNVREIIRLAERADLIDRSHPAAPEADWLLLRSTLEDEAQGLVREILRKPLDERALAGVWQAFPRSAFVTVDAFTELSRSCVRELWKPDWHGGIWEQGMAESWRRLLVRLFTGGIVNAAYGEDADARAIAMVADLCGVVMTAAASPETALLELRARFGDDLSRPYRNTVVGD